MTKSAEKLLHKMVRNGTLTPVQRASILDKVTKIKEATEADIATMDAAEMARRHKDDQQ
jgi:anthranilate phosphoribosyltransferase